MKLQRFLPLIFLMSSSTLYAHEIQTPDNACPPGALCSLASPGGFYIGLTGMWVVPSETSIGDFTDSWEYANADGSFTALSKPAKFNYRWAAAGKIGYDIPCTANNIEVSYLWLHNRKHAINDTSSDPFAFGSVFFNVYLPLVPGEVLVSDAGLKKWVNQIDLTFGHRFTDVLAHLQLHPSFGARYVSMEHNLTFSVGHVSSNYHGVGPVIGVDGDWDFGCGFGASAYFDTALLMGTVAASSHINFGAIFNYQSPGTHRVISTFTGRLGVNYMHSVYNESTAKLELGYQVNRYADPFDIIQGMSPPTQRIAAINSTSFAFAGPYLTLTLHT